MFKRVSILIIPLGFLFLFLILPLFNLFVLSIIYKNQLSIDNYLSILTHPLNIYFLIWDIKQALITTILSVMIGLPFSYMLSSYSFPGKQIIKALITIPFILPPIVVLMSFITVFGTGGWINELSISYFGFPFIKIFNTTEGIILAHLFYNIPLIIRITENGWNSMDQELVLVAKSLGSTRLNYLLKVIIPSLLPSLLISSLLVFIYAFNSFAIVLILGGVQYQTLEVRIYSLVKQFFDYNQAAALTMFQLFINICIIIIYIYYNSKYDSPTRPNRYERPKKKNIFYDFSIPKLIKIVVLMFNSILVFIICVVPIIGVIFRSFTDQNGNFTLKYFTNLFGTRLLSFIGMKPETMIFNTLVIGLIVLVISISLALLLNYGLNYETEYKGSPKLGFHHLTGLIVIIPLTVSSVSIAFSMFSLYKGSFIYINSSISIILAHVLIAFPFANRIIASARSNIDRTYLTVGQSLGLSRTMTFIKIEIPLLFPYIIVAGLFSLAISIGEFGATNFIAKGDFATIPVGIYRLINSRNIGEAAAFSSILIGVTLLLFVIIEKIGKYDYKI